MVGKQKLRSRIIIGSGTACAVTFFVALQMYDVIDLRRVFVCAACFVLLAGVAWRARWRSEFSAKAALWSALFLWLGLAGAMVIINCVFDSSPPVVHSAMVEETLDNYGTILGRPPGPSVYHLHTRSVDVRSWRPGEKLISLRAPDDERLIAHETLINLYCHSGALGFAWVEKI